MVRVNWIMDGKVQVGDCRPGLFFFEFLCLVFVLRIKTLDSPGASPHPEV